ncbi:hypothetical protein JQC91_17480 [Jannaschia sp. Os4]|uniref:hypothetical protein n=1 Tax=Jannaschia sp. Os4 TaxID=2807617 RepID=UPI00193ADD70|nr:hypothetical protein [Jannaschia sp. Os4]MBM2578102.1 hypothetical protein [Jannaschia sp. Os4]
MSGARLMMALLVALATGCAPDGEREVRLDLAAGTRLDGPAYVTRLEAGPFTYPLVPSVARGGIGSFPRDGMGGVMQPIRRVPERFDVTVEWIELATGRAYAATIPVESADLAIGPEPLLHADLSVMLHPGGRVVIGSDPVPETTQVILRDIAEGCARRRPDLDRDLSDQVDAIPRLGRALEGATAVAAPCGGG